MMVLSELPELLTEPRFSSSLECLGATLMQDPTMQNMMAGLMSGGMSQNTGGGLDALLQAGQQLASQMQASNPELVEQLRRHMSNSNSSDASNQDPSAGNPDADN
ncbi:hypothetical protein ISCGN_031033 [Ixodes scapularis]